MYQLVKFVNALTFPPVLSAWIAGIAVLCLVFRFWRTGLGLLLFACTWTFVWSLPACSDWLRGLLDERYPVVAVESLPQADAVVVLGGATRFSWVDDPNVDVQKLKYSRVGTGARVWLAGRAPVIILSGGRGEAKLMAQVMPRLEVPASALVLEERSRDTAENAHYTASIAREHGWQRVLLVTSAIHMPRAMHAFEAAGLEPIPVAVSEDWFDRKGVRRWIPSMQALWRSGRAFKELGGLVESYVKPA